jgi:hypothetical protein
MALARRIADQSAVLLENNGILPLDPARLSSVAVLGPNADRVQFGDYSWSADKKDGITPLEGIRRLAGGQFNIHYAEGCDLWSENRAGIDEAVRAARRSDVAVIFAGTSSARLARASEAATSGEGYDVTDLGLPGVQEELIARVAATGKPVVVVLVTGRVHAMAGVREVADALLVQWYAGEQAGASIADILFGRVNPSGRLPVSLPQSTGNTPTYYNYLPTDKGYYNKKGSPEKPGRDYVLATPWSLYPFGYGLSYSTFEYTGMSVGRKALTAADTVRVSVTVRNTSEREGQEVVQLYARDLVSSVATPIHQLCAFEKVTLAPAESRTVIFLLPLDRLALHDAAMRRVVEPGDFEFQAGPSSADIVLRDTVTVGDPHAPAQAARGSASVPAAGAAVLGAETIVRGTVRDVQATPLEGVRVQADASNAIGRTDRNGKYTLRARTGDTLRFTLDGYRRVTAPVPPSGTVDVEMPADGK